MQPSRSRRTLLASGLIAALAGPTITDAAASSFSAEAERQAYHTILTQYVFTKRTTILDGTWRPSCSRVSGTRAAARCRLRWSSDHAHWTATGTISNVDRSPGFPYTTVRYDFKVRSACVGDACRFGGRQVRTYRWKGRDSSAPA